MVHCPAIEFVVADDGKGHIILYCISFDSLEGIVSVALYAFVDGEEEKVEAVIVAFIEGFEDGGENGRVFAPGGADGNTLARVEEGVGGDDIVDFGFEEGDEAALTEFLVVFGADDEGTGDVAKGALGGWHDVKSSRVSYYIKARRITGLEKPEERGGNLKSSVEKRHDFG